jgi:hypothetical protein
MARLKLRIVITLLFLIGIFPGYAQYDTPVNYMSYLTTIDQNLEKDYMSYMSATAHGASHRKLDRRRKEVLSTLRQGMGKVKTLKPYKGETTLRDAYAEYFSILEVVLNEDYGKIVDMEEVAEQSYDLMETFLLAQERANEKLRIAADTLQHAFRDFAAANNVKLVTANNRVSKKLRKTGEVMKYYNRIYLIYFKAVKQEAYLVAAANEENLSGIEQNRQTLTKYANEGLTQLNKILPFGVDNSLIVACRKLLEFANEEARDESLSHYLLKKDEFVKFKKIYDAKSPDQKTAADVDRYNAGVSDMNASSALYNKNNAQRNTTRATLNEAWRSAVRKFLDEHVPK